MNALLDGVKLNVKFKFSNGGFKMKSRSKVYKIEMGLVAIDLVMYTLLAVSLINGGILKYFSINLTTVVLGVLWLSWVAACIGVLTSLRRKTTVSDKMSAITSLGACIGTNFLALLVVFLMKAIFVTMGTVGVSVMASMVVALYVISAVSRTMYIGNIGR